MKKKLKTEAYDYKGKRVKKGYHVRQPFKGSI